MSNWGAKLVLSLCCWLSCLSSRSSPGRAAAQPVPPDFDQLISLVPGYFDSKPQVEDEIRRGVPVDKRHLQLGVTIRVEDTLTALPQRKNFYIEQWLNGNDSDIIRQRIYSFGVLPDTFALQLKIYELRNASRYVHAESNDLVFCDVTLDDLTYAQGCDVYWGKVSNAQRLMFTSWMSKTCQANIYGQKVTIVDSNNLTSSYLTAYEQWLLSNGTDILREPSPYNLTRQDVHSSGPSAIFAQHPRDPSLPTLGVVLPSLDALLKALFSGYPVRYRATLSTCVMGTPSGVVTPPQEIVAFVDAFEFFNDTQRFFMEPHIGFSSSSQSVDFTGVQMELTEVRVYTTGRVSVDLSFLSGDLRQLLGKVSYNCTTATGNLASNSVTFMKEVVTLTALVTYQDLRDALTNGSRVHSVSDYKHCSINATAVGGSAIMDVKLYPDRMTSSAVKTITNYQGPGYVYDIVTTTYWANGSVIATASDRDVVTFQSYYVEQIDCGVLGDGAATFYSLSD